MIMIQRSGGFFPQVGNLEKLAPRQGRRHIDAVKANTLMRQGVNQFSIHAIGGTQTK
jgi:hypothetical protein